MADDARGKLEEAKGKINNLNTDEELEEIISLLDEAKNDMTGLDGMELESSHDTDYGYRVYNLNLDQATALEIAKIVEEEFKTKTQKEFEAVNVTQIKAPRKAVVRVQE